MSDKSNNARFPIVGASSGIGQAIAAVEAGASVSSAFRYKNKLDAAVAKLRDSARAFLLDIADDAAIEQFFTTEEAWDHVVVSAAQTRSGPVRMLPLTDAKSAMQSKFWDSSRIACVAKINEGRSLTFVSGFLSVCPFATSVPQGAINAALEALAHSLALELAPIRVNAVSPDLIAAPLWSGMADEKR